MSCLASVDSLRKWVWGVGACVAAAVVGIIVVLAPVPLVAALFAALLYSCGSVILRRVGPRQAEERIFIHRLFAAAALVRLAAALSTFYLLPYGFFAPDEVGYVAQGASVGLAGTPLNSFWGDGWVLFNGLFSPLSMDLRMLLPRVASAVVGAAIPVVAYMLVRMLSGRKAATRAGILTAFFPSLIVWSSLNLKDATVQLLLLVAVVLGLELQDRSRLKHSILLLGIAVLVLSLREYLLWPLAAFVVLTQLMALRRSADGGKRVALLFALALAVGAALTTLPAWLSAVPDADVLSTIRTGFTRGAGSAYVNVPATTTWNTAVNSLPVALANFILGPYPWQGGSTLLAVTKPEVVAYYCLIPLALLGWYRILRKSPEAAFPIAFFTVLICVGYSLVIFNFGTAFRMRAIIVIFVLIFAAIGWPRRRQVILSGPPRWISVRSGAISRAG